jgi:hypothetical protein
VPARHQLGSFGVRQELLEAGRERLVFENLVFPPPDQQRSEFRLPQFALKPFEADPERFRRAGSSAARST